VDINGYFTYVNEATARAVGYARSEELIGMSYLHFIHPEDREQVLNTFINQINMRQLSSMQEFRIINTEGKVKWFSFLSTLAINDGQLVGQSGVAQDITERKQAEEAKAKFEVQLQQALKFEAIATLAGGIAHDFNNLLMGIQGRISLVSLNIETSHPHWEHIQAIEEYIRSATNLTRQLLGFAKGGKYEVKPIDMNELVLSSSAMFGRTKKEIRIHTTCKASPLVVEADRGQIEQVLLNMYINAWQAMPLGGGDLSLETNIVALDEVYCKSNKIEPGRYVNVSIKDTGAGMDEATRLRIFDPFFTTKEKSRGTGMGLASALGIIKNHGGMIAVDSEVGHGTTFNIFLPFSDKEAYREVPTDGSCITGSANILLVDDEEFIVVVCQTMLEKLGYRVIVCGGGQEAVKVITDMGNEIDLVILDMIMPGMDGGSTFDHIREIQPDMPVLLSSGYSIDGHADNIIRKGCNGFIQKPYNISELSQKIKKMLDESQKAQLKEQQHS
jgi:PAS domain S-box-containing protein